MGSGLVSTLYCVEPRNKAPLQRFRFRLCSTVVRPFLKKPRNLPRIQLVFRSSNPQAISAAVNRNYKQSILRMCVQILLQFLSITHYPCLRELALERRPLWLSLFTAHQELHQSETAYKISDPESNTIYFLTKCEFWLCMIKYIKWGVPRPGSTSNSFPTIPLRQSSVWVKVKKDRVRCINVTLFDTMCIMLYHIELLHALIVLVLRLNSTIVLYLQAKSSHFPCPPLAPSGATEYDDPLAHEWQRLVNHSQP